MVWCRYLLVVIQLFFCFTYSQATTCSFNNQCECSTNGISLSVSCINFETFPSFSENTANGLDVLFNITGSFTSIPAKTFYYFTGAKTINLNIIGYQQQQLDVDPQAFTVPQGTKISQLLFGNFYFPSIPTTDWSAIDILKLHTCQIPTITDNAFQGFTGQEIDIQQSTVQTVQPNAFNGLGQLNTLSLYGNFLNAISPAFKTLQTEELDFSTNGIYQIPDYSFSSCNEQGGCSSVMTTLFLYYNPVSSISDNAFANLPNLIYLTMSHCALTAVPVNAFALDSLSNLVSLEMSECELQSIEANSFYFLKSLYYVYFDYNPITTIEPGAFNGITQMRSLNLNFLYLLESVDLLITYGMTSLQTLSFTNCSKLTTVELSDYTKLPQSLTTVSMTASNVQSISSDVQYWLAIGKDKYMDISYNANITCDPSIQWMATYVCCSPPQILATGARCSGSKQALSDYLATFKPTCS